MYTAMTSRQQRLASRGLYLSCIVPVHNEETVALEFIYALHQTLSQLTDKFEIIAINDGSSDKTLANLKSLNHLEQFKLISFSRNFGKEVALTAGLEHCTGDVTILIDCDFQHPLKMIPVFLEQWAQGYDMVYGVRRNRDDESKLKRFSAKCFYKLMGLLTKTNIPPDAGDFRLLDRKVVNALNTVKERVRFMKGIYAWVGFQSIAVPFDVQDRKSGHSSWQFGKLTELAITGITSFSEIPLRVWGLIGLLISGIAFAYALYITLHTLIDGVDVPGFASLLVAVMFFGGIQLLSIGILGEYIGRIFNEVKDRPQYIIAETHGFEKLDNDSQSVSDDKISWSANAKT